MHNASPDQKALHSVFLKMHDPPMGREELDIPQHSSVFLPLWEMCRRAVNAGVENGAE